MLHAVLWSHIGIILHLPAAEPRSTAGLIFPSQYLSGTIWFTPYLMVWDWRVSRAGPMPFCWHSCSLLFSLQLFSLYLLFLYRLVVWGWGLQTDRVSISLSRPCIANPFLIIIIIIIINQGCLTCLTHLARQFRHFLFSTACHAPQREDRRAACSTPLMYVNGNICHPWCM